MMRPTLKVLINNKKAKLQFFCLHKLHCNPWRKSFSMRKQTINSNWKKYIAVHIFVYSKLINCIYQYAFDKYSSQLKLLMFQTRISASKKLIAIESEKIAQQKQIWSFFIIKIIFSFLDNFSTKIIPSQ